MITETSAVWGIREKLSTQNIWKRPIRENKLAQTTEKVSGKSILAKIYLVKVFSISIIGAFERPVVRINQQRNVGCKTNGKSLQANVVNHSCWSFQRERSQRVLNGTTADERRPIAVAYLKFAHLQLVRPWISYSPAWSYS